MCITLFQSFVSPVNFFVFDLSFDGNKSKQKKLINLLICDFRQEALMIFSIKITHKNLDAFIFEEKSFFV